MIATFGGPGQTTAAPLESGIVAEIGCANCHGDLGTKFVLREVAPDLSAAGLRYNPAYLFQYLLHPMPVRQHLGRARMPDFHLGEKEALALVAFLETQQSIPGSWPELPTNLGRVLPAQSLSPAEVEAAKREAAVCLGCHTLGGKGGHRAVEWNNVGARLQRGWVTEYLVAPSRFGVAPTNMPAFFYRVSGDGRRFEQIFPRAAEKIQLLASYLFSLNPQNRQELETNFLAAKARFPQANRTQGEMLFRSLNCAACHRHQTIAPRRDNAAPLLAQELLRVTPQWLTNFLRHPSPIRPFGYHPGDGSRMPDFRLSDAEVAEIAGHLIASAKAQPVLSTSFRPQKLSAFSRNKARLLLNQKLSCLGCHRLEEQGGQIGPDLTQVSARLQPEYVYGMITKPRETNPHALMPQIPIPPETAELLANFLLQENLPLRPTTYLSALETPLTPSEAEGAAAKPTGKANYQFYCAQCHGNEGRGNGFNAQFLPQRPTTHADAAYMSTRSDDTLFDGVAAGGAILNKSHFMPSWGLSLSSDEIKGLVIYMRTLCQCKQPAWAADNK